MNNRFLPQLEADGKPLRAAGAKVNLDVFPPPASAPKIVQIAQQGCDKGIIAHAAEASNFILICGPF